MKTNQTRPIKGERPVLQQEFVNDTHSVSWKTNTPGYAMLNAKIHTEAGWLTLVMREQADTGSSKETFITLNKTQVECLKAFLGLIGTEPLKL